MSTFIEKANLPEGQVSTVICGGLNKQVVDYLENRGIEIIYTKKNVFVEKSVSEHADISVLCPGEKKIIIDCGQRELISKLREMGFYVTESEKSVSGAYPYDCILNHTIIGKYIIGNSKIFDNAVKELCHHLEVIDVNQGYCKCSVLVVDEKSVITDDESIARNVLKKGIDCLLISKGDVFLDGHEYGFIGGASGKISKKEIIFFGDITKHRDYKKIKAFIEDRKMDIVSFDFPLTDFGGIIPIKENIL